MYFCGTCPPTSAWLFDMPPPPPIDSDVFIDMDFVACHLGNRLCAAWLIEPLAIDSDVFIDVDFVACHLGNGLRAAWLIEPMSYPSNRISPHLSHSHVSIQLVSRRERNMNEVSAHPSGFELWNLTPRATLEHLRPAVRSPHQQKNSRVSGKDGARREYQTTMCL